jgi:UPF0755 protein
MRSRTFALVLGCAAAALAAAAWSASRLLTAPGPNGSAQVFVVAPDESLGSVARRLDASGLLPSAPLFGPETFVLYARATRADRKMKSGEYELDSGMRPVEILRKLVAGEVMTHPVVLPEGLRIDEVAARLEAAGILPASEFAGLAGDAARARALGIEADGLEGYLYPETYRFPRGADSREVAAAMVEEFRSRLGADDHAAIARSGRSLHEVVTLASIVEKETAVGSERALIAAVFHNRLARGMRLQSDPTVIYGLVRTRGGFDGNLRKRDLLADTPWNTYTRAGLPPGPIASATIDSIRAVLAPADVRYLYFVARRDGTHQFSNTLEEHTRAVNLYQRRRGAS